MIYWAHLRHEFKKVFVKLWQRSWMPKWKEKKRFIFRKDPEWRNESLFTSRPKSSHRIAILTSMNFFSQGRTLLLLSFRGLRDNSKERQYAEDIP